MYNKPKFVIFEGPDKVGKSTLFRLFRSETKYGPLAIDRFTGSNWVYDTHYNRESGLEDLLTSEENLQAVYDCYLIVLGCESTTLLNRIQEQETGMDLTIALENVTSATTLFAKYFDTTRYTKKLWLDTTDKTPEQSLQLILEFIN